MVEDGAFSHKLDYVTMFLEILHLEGHSNHIAGSKITAIFLNGWILPIDGVASGPRLQPAAGLFLIYHIKNICHNS